MDNHQSELANALSEFLVATSPEQLIDVIETGLVAKRKFPSVDASGFVQCFNRMLQV
jgi:UDP-N-acetylglucosamine transferase subunit ALG13